MDFLSMFERDHALRAQYISGRDSQGRRAPLVPAGWGDFPSVELERENMRSQQSTRRASEIGNRNGGFIFAAGQGILAREVPRSRGPNQTPTTSCSQFASVAGWGIDTVLIHDFAYKQPQECAICLQRLVPGSEAAKMPCGESHVFHHMCLLEWLRRKPSCPLCREIPREIKDPPDSPRTAFAPAVDILTRLEVEMQDEIARWSAPGTQHAATTWQDREHLSLRHQDDDAELLNELARLEREMQDEIDAALRQAEVTQSRLLSLRLRQQEDDMLAGHGATGVAPPLHAAARLTTSMSRLVSSNSGRTVSNRAQSYQRSQRQGRGEHVRVDRSTG